MSNSNGSIMLLRWMPLQQGKLDAVAMTNGDALVTGATGASNVAIIINDYSNGNDMVVGGPGIESIKDLKGKKVGVEIGFVSHLLLLNALEKNGYDRSRC